MVVGFMAKELVTAMLRCGTQHPQTKAEAMLATLWDDLCEPIWHKRNNINNGKASCARLDELDSLKDKLEWFSRHQNEVLDYRHRFLVNYTAEEINGMRKETRKKRVQHLQSAMNWYEVECSQRAKNQTTMYDWTAKLTQLRSGRAYPKFRAEDEQERDDDGEAD